MARKKFDFSTSRPHIIDSILPGHTVHILGGASGAGKTRLLFGLIDAWQKGEPILGFTSHPVPWVYIAADRALASVHETVRELGLDPEAIPIFPAFELEPTGGYTLPWLFKQLEESFPEVRFIIIEALTAFIPAGKLIDNQIVGRFIRDLARYCSKRKVTVLCVHHVAKEKANDRYSSPRDKLLGAGALSAFSETVMVLEKLDPSDTENPYRRLYISPRNTVREFVVNYKFDTSGVLHQIAQNKIPQPTEKAKQWIGRPRDPIVDDALTTFFDYLYSQGKVEFTLADATDAVGSQKTAQRRLDEYCAQGTLEKRARGTYRLAARAAVEEAFGQTFG